MFIGELRVRRGSNEGAFEFTNIVGDVARDELKDLRINCDLVVLDSCS